MKAKVCFWLALVLGVIGWGPGIAVADTGWMQPGVRLWYVGAVDGGGVISSNAEETYLINAVVGTNAQVVRHAALTNWTSPQPAETTLWSLLDQGPCWMHPDRLQTVAPGDFWRDVTQIITLVNRSDYTYATFVSTVLPAKVHLLPIKALFDVKPTRQIVKLVFTIDQFSVGVAYFDAETGIVLYCNQVWGTSKMFFVLSEINYDFAGHTAFAEDAGPHAGFKSMVSEQSLGHNFVGGGSVVFQSLVESRYGNNVEMRVLSSYTPSQYPDTGMADQNYCFFGNVPLVTRMDATLAGNSLPEQWNPFGQYLWWWLPPTATQARAALVAGPQAQGAVQNINVFNVPMVKTSDSPLTYVATETPSAFHFSTLWFDSDGYLTAFSAKGPGGLDLQPTDTIFQNLTSVDGRAYYQATMGTAMPAPTVTAVLPQTGGPAGGTAVTITGTGFATGATVTFGGMAATSVTVVSATTITVTTPAHAAGAVDIVVTNVDTKAATLVGGFTYFAPSPVVPVDLDGNHASDVVAFRGSAGQWWIHGQADPVTFGQAGDIPVVADYDGNGRADLAVYRPSTSEWIVEGQAPFVFGQAGDVPVPGDYNGDGKAERAIFRPSTGEWMIDGQPGMTQWGMRGDIPAPADYNGDGIVELAVYRPTTGVWYIQGGETLEWGMWGDVPVAADYNGDGQAEIAVYRPSTGWWYVARGPMYHWGSPGDVPVPLDVDGDGVTEFVVFRPSDGTWYAYNPMTTATSSYAWGEAGDEPVGLAPHLPVTTLLKTAGDFDGDGAADVTVFRPSTGGWYTLQSTHAYRTVTAVILGQDGDVPVPGDYQGTGHQERAVYRPSTGEWLLEDGRTVVLGSPGDVPVPGDYDGDGTTDIAVFAPSSGLWSVLSGASGFTTLMMQGWGAAGDVPAPGDYDGDGTTDFAVFTPATGQWSIRSSLTGATLMTLAWGMSGDIPVPADYDGDGKTDIGVYRPSTGYWYGLFSKTDWSFQWAWWGAEGDIPVPGDYNGDGQAEVAVYRPTNGAWYVMDVMTIIGWGNGTDVPILARK